MNYLIKKCFTENLNISQFPKFSKDEEKVELLINLNTDLSVLDEDNNLFLFRISYNALSKNNPISLNWMGGCLIEFEKNYEDMNEEILLKDQFIKDFVNDIVKSFSVFLNGKLPTIDDILDSHDKH